MIIFSWVLLIAIILYFPHWKALPREEKSLNIFAWGDLMEPSVLAEFEKETGIKVNLSYFSSNEELQVKMIATRGIGYDLIMPSGYAVDLLAKANLLKPINKSKLRFWNNLNPGLLGIWYDPQNTYSIPFSWEVYGLGISTPFFKDRSLPSSWDALYDPKIIDY